MADQQLKIKVNILNRTYPLSIQRNEEEYVRAAAKYIDALLTKMQTAYQVDNKQDLLAMAALQIATKLEKTQSGKQADEQYIKDFTHRFRSLLAQE